MLPGGFIAYGPNKSPFFLRIPFLDIVFKSLNEYDTISEFPSFVTLINVENAYN